MNNRSTWRILRLKRAISRISPPPNLTGDETREPSEANPIPGFSAGGQDVWFSKPMFEEPGIVLSAVGARCGKCFRTPREWSVAANTASFVPRPGFDRDFLWYLMNQEHFWI